MKHILIILSILLLSSFLISCVPAMVYLLTKETYVGERENGKYHGQGTLTFRDGDKYVGEYKDGKQHGQGTYTWKDGDKYVGEWKDGIQHGQGTLTKPIGYKYVGKWKDGKPNGQGTETSHDGEKYVGEWKDWGYWNGTSYDKDGNIIGKWGNGKWIKQ